jgi:hypothetical protein
MRERGSGMSRKIVTYIYFIFVFSITLLSGCIDQESSSQPEPQKNDQDQASPPLDVDDPVQKAIVPLSITEGEFGKISGWLDNETIVYFTNVGQGSSVFTYELLSGKSTAIYESAHPIISIYLSESKERLLIHSAPSSYEGSMTIIDQKGVVLAEETIISSELTFAWNPFNEDLVLISSFTEDWDFQVLLFDLKIGKSQELILPQPIANWLSEDELIYLDWDLNTLAHFAPLVKQKINEHQGEQLKGQNIFQMLSYKNTVATISVSEDQTEAIYSFLTNKLEPIGTFTMPVLTEFADWLVPFYDFYQKERLFYTLKPLTSGEADTYKGGFELVSYVFAEGKEHLIMKGLENKPISLSPNGEYALYGFQFENVIDLQANKMQNLIKEKK